MLRRLLLLAACGLVTGTAAAPPVSVSAADGSIALSFAGADISSTTLGEAAVVQPAFTLAEFSSGASGPPANSSENLAANGDFSAVDPSDPTRAKGWTAALDYPLAYARVTDKQLTRAGHTAAIRVTTPNATAKAGAAYQWNAPTGKPLTADSIIISAWSKALADDGGGGDYALYVDLVYEDGAPKWGSRADFSSGAHDWEYNYHIISLEKPVKEISIYCLYRGRKGSVLFDSVSVGLPACGAASEGLVGSSYAVGDQNNISAVTVHANCVSSLPAVGYNLTATFKAREDHIRVDGGVVTSTSDGSPPPDRAVALSFALPLAAQGWNLWSDTDTPTTIGPERQYSGQSDTLKGSPNPIDLYPFTALTSPDGTEGIMLAIPMEEIVYVQRTHYSTRNSSLVLTFDFGLSKQSDVYPNMAAFSCLVFALKHPQHGFRGALQQYYEAFPHAFLERTIRDQGIWMPFKSDFSTIEGGWEDFGIKFQEGGGATKDERYMNAHGVGIYPYVEPHILHWPLPKGMLATWENINHTVMDCVANPDKYKHCSGDGNDCRGLCKMIAENAVVDNTGKWIFIVEHAEWNEGALLYADLNPTTLNDPSSRATAELGAVTSFYKKAVAEGVTLSGQYIDSTMGFDACGMVNQRKASLRTSAHPPVFDVEGNVGVLFAQSLFSFLKIVSDTVRSRGQYLFGNALFDIPQLSFPGIFDISGTETGWQNDGEFYPPTPMQHRFKRAMTAAQPYLYLMDTDFSTWGYDDTDQYMQICLVYGHWPGFFSADAASATYFDNSSLYNRDRPLFKQFIPALRRINAAGWRPMTFANASGQGAPFQLERWGDGFGVNGSDNELLFTLRSHGTIHSANVLLTVDLKELGILTAGAFTVREIAQKDGWSGSISSAGVVTIPLIDPSTTRVLAIERKNQMVVPTAVTKTDDSDAAAASSAGPIDVTLLPGFRSSSSGALNDTLMIQAAIDAAATGEGGGVVLLKEGMTFVSWSVQLHSHVKLIIDGTLATNGDPNAEWTPTSPARWGTIALLWARNVTNVTITSSRHGLGHINGNGSRWWPIRKKSYKHWAPKMWSCQECSHVRLSNFNVTDSPAWCLENSGVEDLIAENLTINAPHDSPNTDGIGVDCTGSPEKPCIVRNCYISNGDDEVAVGGKNVLVENSHFAKGHGASIGSLGFNGSNAYVTNITFRNLIFNQTETTMRIKTWQGGHGLVSNVTYENIKVLDVAMPILLTQFYCPGSQHAGKCPNMTGVVKIQDVTIKNVSGTHKGDVAGQILCSDTPESCKRIVLEDVHLSSATGAKRKPGDNHFECWQAHGTATDVTPPACVKALED